MSLVHSRLLLFAFDCLKLSYFQWINSSLYFQFSLPVAFYKNAVQKSAAEELEEEGLVFSVLIFYRVICTSV